MAEPHVHKCLVEFYGPTLTSLIEVSPHPVSLESVLYVWVVVCRCFQRRPSIHLRKNGRTHGVKVATCIQWNPSIYKDTPELRTPP